jgi:hypothetical protein
MPKPEGQTAHASQSSRPADAVNVAAGHAAHTRLLLAVAAAAMCVPAAQGVRTGWHADASLVGEKLVPAWHAAHWRSASGDPATDRPKPMGHVDHAVHWSRPAEDVNVPALHCAQTRSLLAVAAAVVCVPATHGWRTSLHTAPSLTSE